MSAADAEKPPNQEDANTVAACIAKLRNVTKDMCTSAKISHSVATENGAVDKDVCDLPGILTLTLTGIRRPLNRKDRAAIVDCCNDRFMCADIDFDRKDVSLHLCSGPMPPSEEDSDDDDEGAGGQVTAPVPAEQITTWTKTGASVIVMRISEGQRNRVCTLVGMWLQRHCWGPVHDPASADAARPLVTLETLDCNNDNAAESNISGLPPVIGPHVVHVNNVHGVVDWKVLDDLTTVCHVDELTFDVNKCCVSFTLPSKVSPYGPWTRTRCAPPAVLGKRKRGVTSGGNVFSRAIIDPIASFAKGFGFPGI